MWPIGLDLVQIWDYLGGPGHAAGFNKLDPNACLGPKTLDGQDPGPKPLREASSITFNK